MNTTESAILEITSFVPSAETVAYLERRMNPQPEGDATVACVSERELFSQEGRETKEEQHERELAAKALCATCPELIQCRETVLRNPDRHMILGGLTPTEVTKLRKRTS